MSQKSDVRNVLESGLSITPIDALNKFGAFRLSAIIFELKNDGLDIKTTLVKGVPNRYARYSLIPTKGDLS